MIIRKAWATGLAAIALLAASPARADTEEEVANLEREVEALRAGQEAIMNDLTEIRKLLEAGDSQPRKKRERPPFKPRDLSIGDSFVIGSATAPVTLFSYSDYDCPYCRRHAKSVLPELIQKFADAGELRIVMREMPIAQIHPRAPAAAQAAVCAGQQGKYLEMHDLLFAERKKHSDEDLKGYGETLGLDSREFESCLEDPEVKAGIEADIAEGKSMNITGTPSFVLGPTDAENPDTVRGTLFVRGAQPLNNFEAAMAQVREPKATAEAGADSQPQGETGSP